MEKTSILPEGLNPEKPDTDLTEKDKEEERNTFREKGNYTKINDLVCYGIDDIDNLHKDLHIHLTPSEDITFGEKIKLFREGLRCLAGILIKDENITQISATSWIVKKNPNLLKKLGFDIDESVKTSLLLGSKRIAQFRSRPLGRATISREKFLKLYSES